MARVRSPGRRAGDGLGPAAARGAPPCRSPPPGARPAAVPGALGVRARPAWRSRRPQVWRRPAGEGLSHSTWRLRSGVRRWRRQRVRSRRVSGDAEPGRQRPGWGWRPRCRCPRFAGLGPGLRATPRVLRRARSRWIGALGVARTPSCSSCAPRERAPAGVLPRTHPRHARAPCSPPPGGPRPRVRLHGADFPGSEPAGTGLRSEASRGRRRVPNAAVATLLSPWAALWLARSRRTGRSAGIARCLAASLPRGVGLRPALASVSCAVDRPARFYFVVITHPRFCWEYN